MSVFMLSVFLWVWAMIKAIEISLQNLKEYHRVIAYVKEVYIIKKRRVTHIVTTRDAFRSLLFSQSWILLPVTFDASNVQEKVMENI